MNVRDNILWPNWGDAYDNGYRHGAGDWFLYGFVIGLGASLACGLLALWLIWGGA